MSKRKWKERHAGTPISPPSSNPSAGSPVWRHDDESSSPSSSSSGSPIKTAGSPWKAGSMGSPGMKSPMRSPTTPDPKMAALMERFYAHPLRKI
jgi:hypothetical protein